MSLLFSISFALLFLQHYNFFVFSLRQHLYFNFGPVQIRSPHLNPLVTSDKKNTVERNFITHVDRKFLHPQTIPNGDFMLFSTTFYNGVHSIPPKEWFRLSHPPFKVKFSPGPLSLTLSHKGRGDFR